MQISRSKTVNETISLIADFQDFLEGSETISSYTVTNTVFFGDDSDPTDMLYLSTEIHKGYLIEQRFRLGIPGVVYEALFSATTSDDHVYEIRTRLAVLPNIGGATPVFIPYYLTSQPYPLNNTEVYQSPTIVNVQGLLALQPWLGPEGIQGTISGFIVDIFGGGVTYAGPSDNMQATVTLNVIDIYGGGVEYTGPAEAITGAIALMSIDIYGSGVTYSNPAENIRGTIILTSIEIT